MFGRDQDAHTKPFDDDVLDEIEGEALIVVDNPDHYAPITVKMAQRVLSMARRLRQRQTEDGGRVGQTA